MAIPTPPVPPLRRRTRIHEVIIQGLLFLCGLISIFVTTGIIYELSKEAYLFFGYQQWLPAHKPLVADISPEQALFEVGAQGPALEVGSHYRIGDEIMCWKLWTARSFRCSAAHRRLSQSLIGLG